MPEIGIGARVRKSPFFEATVEAGATTFTIYNHMYMPISYGDPLAEYSALTERVCIWDVAAERQVEIVGAQAAELTQRLSARDLSKCKVGRARYAPMCDHAGHLINDPVILKLADDRFWLSIADLDILLWAKAVAGEGNYDAHVFEPDASPLGVQGPKAEALVAELVGDWVRDIPFFGHAPTTLDGINMVVCRSGWSHQGGFELFLTDGNRGTDLWNLVWDAGQKYDISPGGPHFQERVESDLLSFGADHPLDADPFEVGLGKLVNLDSEVDFIGKAALIAKRDRGLQRARVGLHVDGDPIFNVENPWDLSLEGESIGSLRVGVISPRFERNIAIGFINIVGAEPGTQLIADSPQGPRTATVVPLPFA